MVEFQAIVAPMAVAFMLVAPTAASAATISVFDNNSLDGRATVAVEAPPGERNELELTKVDERTVTVAYRHAPLTPGAGCAALAPGSVRCAHPTTEVTEIVVRTGDGDDRVVFRGNARLAVDGGPGADALTGSGGGDSLSGGGGRDVLLGGAGRDFLEDGDVTGALGDLAPGADVLDGGPGRDRVSYSQRRAPLLVDLLTSAGGQPGERDLVRSVEDATGGLFRNTLSGTPGPNELEGYRGDDTLTGRGGNDELWAAAGRDRIACGPGRDSVRAADGADLLARDCEAVSPRRGGDDLEHFYGAQARLVRGTAELRIRCYPDDDPDDGRQASCRGRVRLVALTPRPTPIGSVRFRRPRARGARLVVPLSPRGRRLARRGVVTRIVVSGRGLAPGAWKIRLGGRGR